VPSILADIYWAGSLLPEILMITVYPVNSCFTQIFEWRTKNTLFRVFQVFQVCGHPVLMGNPSQSYGASLAIWDHTVLPTATRHKWTRPALTPANQACTRFTYPGGIEGWVDLGSLIAARPGIEPMTAWSQVRRPNHYANESPVLGSSYFSNILSQCGFPQPMRVSWVNVGFLHTNPVYTDTLPGVSRNLPLPFLPQQSAWPSQLSMEGWPGWVGLYKVTVMSTN